jgi:hypothetical protein
VSTDVGSVRLEWEDAYRRFGEVSRDPAREESLRDQLHVLLGELRKRVGGAFTLAELTEVYRAADDWSRDALSELGAPGWPRTLTLVEGAAFHVYSRGAVDYAP